MAASTLACALAVTATRSGHRTMLIDGDPLGGGLDVLLGGERAGGLRWPDRAESQGRVSSGALEESLPRLHDLSVLSWDRGVSAVITPEAMRSVLCAARRRDGVVVGGSAAPGGRGRDRDAFPDRRRESSPRPPGGVEDRDGAPRSPCGRSGPFPPGLDDEEIARLLGFRLVGELPSENGLLHAVDGSQPPGAGGRGPLARFCSAFLAEALAGGGSVTS